MRWAYGVTTHPIRRDNLLIRTLSSLKAAGFGEPRLFVDGTDDLSGYMHEFRLQVTVRTPIIRTAHNWMLSIAELYYRDPEAELFALFQDDFSTYKNLRAYLDKCATTFPKNGYWNLYTMPSNEIYNLQAFKLPAPESTKHVGFYESNQHGRGAVALVLSRQGVIELLSSRHMAERPCDNQRGHKSIDGGIVEAFKRIGWKEYVHNPSLVYHLGEQSSMGSTPQRQTLSFRGEDFDALDLVSESKSIKTSWELT